MDERKPPESGASVSAGESFVKRIGPAGCVLFLALAVLVAAICLTSGRDPIPGYAPPESTEYYAAHPEELVAELTENVFPALPEYGLTATAADGAVTVTVDGNLAAARAALLRYFDESLLSFQRADGQ